MHGHDDGRADDECGDDQRHGEAVGGAVDLVAHALEVRQLNAHVQAPSAGVAQQAAQVVRQLFGHGERAAQGLPGAAGHGLGLVASAHHLAQQRQGFGGHVKRGVEPSAHALQRDEGFDEQGHVGGQAEVVFAQDGGHVGQHLAEVELGQRDAVVLVYKGFDVGFEQREVDALFAAVFVAGPVQQHIDHGFGVALDQAEQQVEQFVAAALREAPDHAEVNKGDAVVSQIKHVAGVRIGMKKAVLHDHFQHRLAAALGQQVAVEAVAV